MRSALITAALAVGALAVPFNEEKKRALVIDTKVDVVYVTDYTTITINGAAPTAAADVATTTPALQWGASPPAWSPPAQSAPPAAPASPAPAPSSGGSSGTGTGAPPTAYSDIVILAHNLHRKNHSAVDLTWDDGLAASAATIAASCVYAHNVDVDGGGYGQNIAAGVSADNVSAVITDLFYNGEVNNFNGLYGQANPSMVNFGSWGHFSQIVWKATTTVACATQDCSGQGLANVGGDVSPYFTVCNYGGPGNVAGEYGENIGEPLGEPTAQWNTGL